MTQSTTSKKQGLLLSFSFYCAFSRFENYGEPQNHFGYKFNEARVACLNALPCLTLFLLPATWLVLRLLVLYYFAKRFMPSTRSMFNVMVCLRNDLFITLSVIFVFSLSVNM